MKYLTKISMLRPVVVDFPAGRSVTFIQNSTFILSDDEVEFLKENHRFVFDSLLKLKPKCKPQKEVFSEVAEKLKEMIQSKVVMFCPDISENPEEGEELEKFLEDEPDVDPDDLIEFHIIEGDEPE